MLKDKINKGAFSNILKVMLNLYSKVFRPAIKTLLTFKSCISITTLLLKICFCLWEKRFFYNVFFWFFNLYCGSAACTNMNCLCTFIVQTLILHGLYMYSKCKWRIIVNRSAMLINQCSKRQISMTAWNTVDDDIYIYLK